MKKEKRTPFEIQRDINEAREKMASAVRSRNYPMTQVYSTRIAHLTRELEDVEADAKFFEQERNQDPALTQWAGKTLALTLNMADLAIYYYDLYMEYFARRGFPPSPNGSARPAASRKPPPSSASSPPSSSKAATSTLTPGRWRR